MNDPAIEVRRWLLSTTTAMLASKTPSKIATVSG